MKTRNLRAGALAAACSALLIASPPVLSNSGPADTSLFTQVYEQADSPWMNSRGKLTENVGQLIRQIQESPYHGLNPNNYRLEQIVELKQSLRSRSLTLRERHRTLAELESALDSAYYKLADHLGSSLIEGRDVQDYIFRSSPQPLLKVLYESVALGDMTIEDLFQSIVPTHLDYVQLQDVLRDLMYEKKSGYGRTLVPTTDALSVGDVHVAVRAAKLRLLETKDFSGSSGIVNVFDEPFKDAVIAFQTRHHISPTGELNTKTVEAMNRTVDDDITQVVVSLERWRWMPRELGHQRVIANVPDFRIRMYNGDQKIVDMATVVGKRKHRTPLFSESIKHVVAAPTWTVPRSITNRELVPIERKNPGYLQSRNYELLAWKGGRAIPVPFSEVPRSAYNSKNFPYTIRQKAGPNNALGKLKILMPNKYAIYFHDTQAKKLFGREYRAYSHGCVRLSDPDRLASMIMQVDGMPADKVQKFLASEKTKQYNLNRYIDSHIVYFTTFVDDKGRLNFRNDVYRYDKKITRALKNNSLLSILDTEEGQTILAAAENIGI